MSSNISGLGRSEGIDASYSFRLEDVQEEQIQNLTSSPARLEGRPVEKVPTRYEKVIDYLTLVPRIIWVAITELFLGLTFGVLSCLFMKKNTDPDTPKQNKPAILLLHGLGHNQSGFHFARKHLDKDEYGSVYSMNYARRFTNGVHDSIIDYAEKVKDKVKQIKLETGQNEVILIGHSMGGLVSAAFAEEVADDTKTQIKHVITLGTPWHGSPIADKTSWALPQNVIKELRQDSELIQRLAKKEEVSRRDQVRQYHNLCSSLDQMVPYRNAAISTEPKQEYTFTSVGHLGLLVSPGVWKTVSEILDSIYSS